MNEVNSKLKTLIRGRWMDRRGVKQLEQEFVESGRSGLISIENIGLKIIWRGKVFNGIIYTGEPDRIARVWTIELPDNVVRDILLKGEFTQDSIMVDDRVYSLPDFGADTEESIVISLMLPPGSRLRRSMERWLSSALDRVSIINIPHERADLIIMSQWRLEKEGIPEGDFPVIIVSEVSIPIDGEGVFLMTSPFTRNQFFRLLREVGLLK